MSRLILILVTTLCVVACACVNAAPALRRHLPGHEPGAHPHVHPGEGVVDSDGVSIGRFHLRHDDSAPTPPPYVSTIHAEEHRQLGRFIPNEYNEFAHLAEYISVSIGAANAAAEEKAKKEAEEAERERVNGLVYSTDSSSAEEHEAEQRRKALRAYGIGSDSSGTPMVETAAPTKPPTPAQQKKSLLASIGW